MGWLWTTSAGGSPYLVEAFDASGQRGLTDDHWVSAVGRQVTVAGTAEQRVEQGE